MKNTLRIPKEFTGFYDSSVMSNSDHSIDNKVAKFIKGKPLFAQYAGWNFCGWVWWQNNKWHCEVWTYGSYTQTFDADTLLEIMDNVSWEYGYD